ncbi:hypothetical protein [Rhizobium leguminosarum]|uniref:hypothetical protein n=1 Tax=Rhizobium leguminosarum TaxID=384 RepID=UPI001C94D604|nr:hypothetical protein [Rhizobium leguminosarum]MBY5544047.1 hypothetical protein [Rhizobium leguminosarum]MBY5664118.1 hypothetical protein [Rhizobium leguminosarum]MBY5678057.1 hypothetical protein [Rhizobium leguminosarum]
MKKIMLSLMVEESVESDVCFLSRKLQNGHGCPKVQYRDGPPFGRLRAVSLLSQTEGPHAWAAPFPIEGRPKLKLLQLFRLNSE